MKHSDANIAEKQKIFCKIFKKSFDSSIKFLNCAGFLLIMDWTSESRIYVKIHVRATKED